MNVYTPPAPSASGMKLTASQLINTPVLVHKAITSMVAKQLVGGVLLGGRLDVTGTGSAAFEGEEAVFSEDAAQVVGDLAEFPLTGADDGELSVYTVDKYGLAMDVPYKFIARNRIDLIMRRMRQMSNRVVAGFDGRIMSLIASGVTATEPATAAWGTSSANPLRDILRADAKIIGSEKGFEGTVIALDPLLWAELASSSKVLEHAAQAGEQNPLVSGKLFRYAGKTFASTNYLPANTDVMVVDPESLGTIMWEDQGGGYMGDPSDVSGVETKVIPLEKQDGVRIQIRKAQEPVIVESEAAVRVTGAKA